jgi:outer membrane lipoprotein-sorting protein
MKAPGAGSGRDGAGMLRDVPSQAQRRGRIKNLPAAGEMRLKFCFLLSAAALLLSCAFLLFVERASAAESRNGRSAEVISLMLRGYGGADDIAKITSVTAKGRITEYVSGKSGSYVRYFKRPGKLRVDAMPEQGGEIRILNRDHGWEVSDGTVSELSPLELQSMLYQYSYLDLPILVANGSYRAEYITRETFHNQKVYLLLIDPKNWATLAILVDAKTGLVLRADASFAAGAAATAELSTEFADYRSVAGVQFPHKITSYAAGIALTEIALDSVEVNHKIPPELFSPQQPKTPQKEK